MNFNKLAFIKNYLYNSLKKTYFKNNIYYLVAIFFIFFIFLIEYFVWNSNSFSFLFLHDAYTQTFPWMARVLEGWRNFDIPFWTWGSGLGISLIGELQPGVLYPFTILASIFHGNEINTINNLIFLHAFIAATGIISCGVKLKSNIIISSFLGIGWAYFLLRSRGFGQANLYYGYCYISWISAIFLDIFQMNNMDNKSQLYPSLKNSISLALLSSLSILAGHTYATIGIFVFWVIYFILFFLKSFKIKIKKDSLINWFIFLITFLGLSIGQLLATSEYFRLSRKWYGEGSTVYPHIVPANVIANFGVSINQVISNFLLGKEFQDSATSSNLMPGINFLFWSCVIFLVSYNFILSHQKVRIDLKNEKEINLIDIKYLNFRRSNKLFIASLLILFLSVLPTFNLFGINFGAIIYKIIPILSSVRLPGRLLPIADIGLILALISYFSNFNIIFNKTKTKKIVEIIISSILILIFFFKSINVSRIELLKAGNIGKESKNNPEFLLNSDCNNFFTSINKNSYGLIDLYNKDDKQEAAFPRNLGDLPGYPRFVPNIFRSSLTKFYLSADKHSDKVSTFNIDNPEIRNNTNGLKCEYNGEFYFFKENDVINNNKFNSFISLEGISKEYQSSLSKDMIIKNHKIVFGTPLNIDQSFNLATKNKPFIKAPFYPGWKIKTISGNKFEVINQNNFMGFPNQVYGEEIKEIYYSPKWLIFVYLQLFLWLSISIFYILRLLGVL